MMKIDLRKKREKILDAENKKILESKKKIKEEKEKIKIEKRNIRKAKRTKFKNRNCRILYRWNGFCLYNVGFGSFGSF